MVNLLFKVILKTVLKNLKILFLIYKKYIKGYMESYIRIKNISCYLSDLELCSFLKLYVN